MAIIYLTELIEHKDGYTEVDLPFDQLQEALLRGTRIMINYLTPSGKTGQVEWNKSIQAQDDGEVRSKLHYTWETRNNAEEPDDRDTGRAESGSQDGLC